VKQCFKTCPFQHGKTHDHKSKITSKVLHSTGMTNSIQRWHKKVSAISCPSHSHVKPYLWHLTKDITKLHNMHSITNSDAKLNQLIQNTYRTINNQQWAQNMATVCTTKSNTKLAEHFFCH